MKTAVFLLVTLKIASASFISESHKKIQEISKESLNFPLRRILGGMPAAENQFPFMVVLVHLQSKHRFSKCSGSLIKTDLVLTAAHCTLGRSPEKAIVVGGQANLSMYFKKRLKLPPRTKSDFANSNTEERWPSAFITHPGYKKGGDRFHDIALVQLRAPFTLPNITTVSISFEKMQKPMLCTILGWGLTEKNRNTNILHYTYAMAKPSDWGCEFIAEGPVICLEAGKAATCLGDSGGPLLCNNKVWGVAAYIRFTGKARCDEGVEDYYTEIYSELDWLSNPTSRGSPFGDTSKNMFFSLIFVFHFI